MTPIYRNLITKRRKRYRVFLSVIHLMYSMPGKAVFSSSSVMFLFKLPQNKRVIYRYNYKRAALPKEEEEEESTALQIQYFVWVIGEIRRVEESFPPDLLARLPQLFRERLCRRTVR